MAKQKKKGAAPAWALSAGAAQPRAKKGPSTPFDHACADLAAAMQRVMRASVRHCYGEGAELALDLGPRAPRQPEQRRSPGESIEPVLVALGSALPVEPPGRIVARCVSHHESGFWSVVVGLGPHAASSSRTYWRLLDVQSCSELPRYPHTLFLTVSVVSPHEAPPEARREHPYCALHVDGRDHFVLATCIDSQRRGKRANLTELVVLTSIVELLARAGEDEDFDALREDDPSGAMTRLAFVDGDGPEARVEWGTVARPEAPDDDGDYEGPFDDVDEGALGSRWMQVDEDVLDELIEYATRLELDTHLDEAEAFRSVTVVLIESPIPELPVAGLDHELQLRERYLAILDTLTLEHLTLDALDERTLPGAVRQVLEFFELQQGGRLPHQLLVEDDDLQEALSELLDHQRREVDLPAVEVGFTESEDASSRFVKASLVHSLIAVQEVHEREAPTRSHSAVADAAEARDFTRLGAAQACLELLALREAARSGQYLGSFVFPDESEESAVRRDELEYEDPHFELGQLAHRVLAAVDGPTGAAERGGQGDGWLTRALQRGGLPEQVIEPLRALVGTAPDLYLVLARDDEVAQLESLTTGAAWSMRVTILTPAARPGEVLPLRRWPFGASELSLPAGKPLSQGDAQDLLERVRAQFGGVDASALRAAAATILRSTFARA